MDELRVEIEQLTDIIKGRMTYDSVQEWEDNILAQLQIVNDKLDDLGG